jgi:hypothetical protein
MLMVGSTAMPISGLLSVIARSPLPCHDIPWLRGA